MTHTATATTSPQNLKNYLKEHPRSLVARAYEFAERAHSSQRRKTGEPYFIHALATAETLHQWRLDDHTIAAGLLHDTVEDTPTTLGHIEKQFGNDIAFLVDGVTKLGRIRYRGTSQKSKEMQAENLRKLILAISKDVRVVFIKLADRLHNMRTLYALPPAKQKRIALETAEIYAPLAYRLGMQSVSGELTDRAFPYLHPKEYEWLIRNVQHRYEVSKRYLERIKPHVKRVLKEYGIVPRAIDFRAKRYASLYRKLIRYNMDIERIYDLVAFRIIVDSVEDCYAALGAIHARWPPLPGRIKDYIAMPKPNGYRSLHTTVIGPNDRMVELQIRTAEMHEENEHGIAAHWMYKQHRAKHLTGKAAKRLPQELAWVRQLRKWQEQYVHDLTDPNEFLSSMKIDFFKDRIFTITPKGDVIDLPAGATPIDFAYTIHSEVGDTCTGAKVNDKFVGLDYELQSGDLVEILTQKNKKPSEDWLRFVKTSIARDHIKTTLRKKRSAFAKKSPTKTEFRIVVEDRIGLIKDITSVLARSHIDIITLHTYNPTSKFPIDKIECALADKKKVERLVLKLKKVAGVREVSYRIL